jgi:hypothetical protein
MPATVVKFKINQITYPDACVSCGAKKIDFTCGDFKLCSTCYEPENFDKYMQSYVGSSCTEYPITVIKKLLDLNTCVKTHVRLVAVVTCMYKILIDRFDIYRKTPFHKRFHDIIISKANEFMHDPCATKPFIDLLATAHRMYSEIVYD